MGGTRGPTTRTRGQGEFPNSRSMCFVAWWCRVTYCTLDLGTCDSCLSHGISSVFMSTVSRLMKTKFSLLLALLFPFSLQFSPYNPACPFLGHSSVLGHTDSCVGGSFLRKAGGQPVGPSGCCCSGVQCRSCSGHQHPVHLPGIKICPIGVHVETPFYLQYIISVTIMTTTLLC